MSALRDSSGVMHAVSDGIDGMSPSRLYALCDIMACVMVPRGSTYNLPAINWAHADVEEDAIPNCLRCVVAIRAAIKDR